MTSKRVHHEQGRSEPLDDFKRIIGIGPVIESYLHSRGIYTFAQLAKLSPTKVAAIVGHNSPRRIINENWIGQARKLASRKRAALSTPVGSAGIAGKLTVDDFELIEGICPEVVRSLNAAGIFSYAQLAELSFERLANLVPGLSAKREAYQSWLKQAHQLATKRVTARYLKKTTHTRGRPNSTTVELYLNEDNRVQYMRVTHTRCGVKENWSGWDESRLIDFLVRHAGLNLRELEPIPLAESDSAVSMHRAPVTTLVPKSRPVPEPLSSSESVCPPMPLGAVPSSLDLETKLKGQLRIYEFKMTPINSDVACNCIHTGDIFNCRVVVDFANVEVSPDVPLSYTTTICAKKLGEKSHQMVGTQQGATVLGEEIVCAVAISLGAQGIYRLEAIVTLMQPDKTQLPQHRFMAMCTGGLLHVY